jgi:hypothetical protein
VTSGAAHFGILARSDAQGSVRLLDAYGPGLDQDLLINASADLPVAHNVFLPAPRWFAQSYSTCLPYRAGAGLVVVGLLPPDRRGPGPSLDAMRAALSNADVSFDPWNTGGGLLPATWLNRLRREAYRQSRLGRGAPPAG